MARNGSGTYVPPTGNPVATGTTITSTWANNTITDIGSEITNSLPRDGQVGMTGTLKMIDGTAAVPSLCFTSEPSTGAFRPATGVLSLSTLGVERVRIDSTGNVGIGKTPTEALDIQASGRAYIVARSGGTGSTASLRLVSSTSPQADWSLYSGTGSTNNLSFYDNVAATERARIDSSGNLGVGVAPTVRLQAQAAATVGDVMAAFIHQNDSTANSSATLSLSATNNSSRAAWLQAIGSGSTAGNGHALAILTSPNGASPVERLRVDNAGQLLIGTTTPTSFVTIQKDQAASTRVSVINNNATGFPGVDVVGTNTTLRMEVDASATAANVKTTTASILRFGTGNNNQMTLDTSGNLGVGGTSGSTDRIYGYGTFNSSWGMRLKNDSTGTSADARYMLDNGTQTGGLVLRGSSYGTTANHVVLYNSLSNPIAFFINGSEVSRFDGSGNLNIGVTATYTTPFTATAPKLNIGTPSKAVAILRGAASADASSCGVLALQRTQASSPNTLTSTSANDTLGLIEASGVNTTPAIAAAAQIRFEQDGIAGGNPTGRIVLATAGGASPIERVRIDSNGFVGINTTPSAYHLEVGGQAKFGTFTLRNSLSNLVLSNDSAASGTTKVSAAGSSAGLISFHRTSTATTADESMRIDSSGNVGIGTTTVASGIRLHTQVAGTASATSVRMSNDTDAGYGQLQYIGSTFATSTRQNNLEIFNSSTTGSVTLHTNSTERVRITSGGDLQTSGGNISMVGATPMIAASDASSQLRLGTAGSERARIDASGNFGVGTTPSGTYKFEVSGSAYVSTGFTAGDSIGTTATGSAAATKLFVNCPAAQSVAIVRILKNGTDQVLIDNNGNLLVAAAGLGYGTGSGGTVTQATSRTTGVTLNKTNGAITLVSAAGTTAWQTFTVTNSTVAASDFVQVIQKSGTDSYQIFVTGVAAGSFKVTFATTGGTTTEQPVFTFVVLKAVTA